MQRRCSATSTCWPQLVLQVVTCCCRACFVVMLCTCHDVAYDVAGSFARFAILMLLTFSPVLSLSQSGQKRFVRSYRPFNGNRSKKYIDPRNPDGYRAPYLSICNRARHFAHIIIPHTNQGVSALILVMCFLVSIQACCYNCCMSSKLQASVALVLASQS
jgi:hypothetical protein